MKQKLIELIRETDKSTIIVGDRYRKHSDGCQLEMGLEALMKKVKGLSTNWQLQNSHGDMKGMYRKQSSQRTYMHDPWTRTTVWGLPEGVHGGSGTERRGTRGGGESWDNYNSINKI